MAFCVACGNKVQNDDVFCMHCGTRPLLEKQTEELPTLAEFMGIKSEERINRFLKKRGSDFGSDNSQQQQHKSSCYAATALNGNGGSKRKRSSEFKLNELVTIQVGIISGDEKEETLHIIRGSSCQ